PHPRRKIPDDAKGAASSATIVLPSDPLSSSDRKIRMGKWHGYRRTGKAALLLVLILGVALRGVSAAFEDEGLLTMAQELYEEGDYVRSVELLETVTPRTEEVIYWLWKNEKEIGRLAGPGSGEDVSPYYVYAQNHPEYLSYNEVFGGEYTPTRKRYEELKASFPRSEYTGTVLFELIEYEYAAFSEGGLDEEGRLALISSYQKFINRYPQHTLVKKAEQEIEALEKWGQKFETLGFEVGRESMLAPYEKRINIDQQVYRFYVNEWLESGWFREYPIEILLGKEELDRFNIPGSAKRGIQILLEDGYLIVISEAAFQRREWQGPKFLVFEPKKK
ncbi:MAG: hypothetical protein ACE5MG_02905, partial [Candidatus Methylomirabilales bacterium]